MFSLIVLKRYTKCKTQTLQNSERFLANPHNLGAFLNFSFPNFPKTHFDPCSLQWRK